MTYVVPWWEGPGKVILWGWSQSSRRPAGVEPAQFYDCLGFIIFLMLIMLKAFIECVAILFKFYVGFLTTRYVGS